MMGKFKLGRSSEARKGPPVPPPAPELVLTTIEKELKDAGPKRPDGSDTFVGFANTENNCYLNSVLQPLFHTQLFRQFLLQHASELNNTRPTNGTSSYPPNADTPPHMNGDASHPTVKGMSAEELRIARLNAPPPSTPLAVAKHKDPNSPESKKEMALNNGPVHYLTFENASRLGRDQGEDVYTALMDIFNTINALEGGITNGRTGVIYPQRFLEIFKMENEMFRSAMHQDAHEFFGLVLNSVIRWFEENEGTPQHSPRITAAEHSHDYGDGTQKMNGNANGGIANGIQDKLSTAANAMGMSTLSPPLPQLSPVETLKSIFEGVLTSETRCLTCEITSQRHETFLDLSIDLEEHSSVTSCLLNFSAEEMLCERNKFHCDNCGGLQEAEKRMKIKKLPKILTLHLKRFKYTDDMSRLLKVGARVLYPYNLRLFNTLPEAEGGDGKDKLYELYAIVVHVGGNAYQGHYVSVVKTPEWGWLLFDDEMVERVDKSYVRSFFGEKPGSATAYVLFYQETTEEDVRREQEAEGLEEVQLATAEAGVSAGHVYSNGTIPGGVLEQQLKEAALTRSPSLPVKMAGDDGLPILDHAATSPIFNTGTFSSAAPPSSDGNSTTFSTVFSKSPGKSSNSNVSAATRDYKAKMKLEEKARKAAEKEVEKERLKADDRARKEKHAKRKEIERRTADELKAAMQASKETAKRESAIKALEAAQREKEQAERLVDREQAARLNVKNSKENFNAGSPSSGGLFGSMKGGLSRNRAGSRSVSGKKSFTGWLGKDKTPVEGKIEEESKSAWDDVSTPSSVPPVSEIPAGIPGAGAGVGVAVDGVDGAGGQRDGIASRGRPPPTARSKTADGLPESRNGSSSHGGSSRFSFGLGRKKSVFLGSNGA